MTDDTLILRHCCSLCALSRVDHSRDSNLSLPNEKQRLTKNSEKVTTS